MSTRSTRRILPFLLALFAVSAAPMAARAQSVLDEQAKEVTRLMSDAGMSRRNQQDGTLAQGRSVDFSINIAAASDVLISGFCDGDCSDLDLEILQNGTTLSSDFEEDDVPIVSLSNWSGGTVTLRVSMAACAAQACAFRVLTFGR